MNRQIFSEKMTESVKTEKFDGNNRKTWMGESKGIKKIKPYYLCITLNLIVINVNVQLSQTENATSPSRRRTNCFCLLVLQQSVGILETTHWRLLQTGYPLITHSRDSSGTLLS